ncbi:ATP-dependent DNA helicase [Trichonephila clavipes]|nr:ATP-dependent DNA helicase [Trichonephila clavipes]
MLDKIPGESQTYLSINTVCNPDEAVNYPTEFLNSIIVPGPPPHKLELKICVPFILLRNLNPPKLCNGTKAASSVIAKKRYKRSHNIRMWKRQDPFFLQGIDNHVPKSCYEKYDASHYRKIAEKIGFSVVLCQTDLKVNELASHQDAKDAFDCGQTVGGRRMDDSISEIVRQLGFSRSTVSREYLDNGLKTSNRANSKRQ